MAYSDCPQAEAWSKPEVVNFFDTHRNTEDEIYPSEWFFIKDCLKENINILDIGCAQGGFGKVFKQHLDDFTYTGIDISSEMIARARQNLPEHTFHHIEADDFAPLKGAQYDLVLCLGILHLHPAYQKTIEQAWQHCQKALILDFRETSGQTIDNIDEAYMSMDFGEPASGSLERLPYIILNSGEALQCIEKTCPGQQKIEQYGYTHSPSSAAHIPLSQVTTKTYRVSKARSFS